MGDFSKPDRNKKRILIGSASLGVLAIMVFIILALSNGWFNRRALPQLDTQQPGSAAASPVDGLVYDNPASDRLAAALRELLESNIGLESWYQLPVRTLSQEAERSGVYLAADQIRYGFWLLEQSDKRAFHSWNESFRQSFYSDGFVVSARISGPDRTDELQAASWSDTLAYARLILTACDVWMDVELWQQVNRLSEALLTVFGQPGGPDANYAVAIPTPAIPLEPDVTPTPKPEISPTPVPPPIYQLTELASIDLLAMRQLIQVDETWEDIYTNWLSIIRQAYISDALPLYARAVWPDHQNYLLFAGEQPNIDTESSLLVLLHLSEVGEADQRSLRWLSEQMFNQFALYEAYHAAQGHSVVSDECVAGYAITARIARITGDALLYERAIDRLVWHLATNPRSDALDMVFRQDSKDQIRVFAHDNTWALLAMN